MALSILKTPEVFSCCGLSEINPITLVVKATAGETVAQIVLYQITGFNTDSPSEVEIVTTQAVVNNQNVANFELSTLLKPLFLQKQRLGNTRKTPTSNNGFSEGNIYGVWVDDSYKFIKYKVVLGEETFEGFCTYANKTAYNRYYTAFPDNIPNDQTNFFEHTIVGDDIQIPTYELVDFAKEDFNSVDFN